MKISRKSLPKVFIIAGLAFSAPLAAAQENVVAKNVPSIVTSPATPTPNEPKDAASVEPVAATARPNLGRVGVQTSDTMPLTLDDAIRKALTNNNNIEISRDDVRFQETQIRALRGIYDPVLTATPTYTRNSSTGSPATNDFSINSSFTQQLGTGGNYTGFFNNTRTENAFTAAQVSSGSIGAPGSSALYFSSYGVRFSQPLFRNRSIDNTRRNLKIARKRLEQTDADFRRTTIETIQRVQQVYWDLVFALRDQQNRQANLDLSRENLRQVEARIAAGAAAPLAKAEVETELANRESDLLLSTQQVSIVENNLKQLLLGDPLAAEWSRNYVPTDRPAFSMEPVSLDDAMKDAMANRQELRRLKAAAEINKIDIDYFKNQTKPQIDLNTSVSLEGLSRSGTSEEFTTNLYTSPGDIALLNGINQVRTLPNIGLTPVPNPTIIVPAQPGYRFGGFGQSLANTFRSDAPNYSVGVTISFPFGNRTAKANLAGAEIQQNQLETQLRAQEQTVMVEVRNAVQAVETGRQRVLTSRRARENAEIQLEGERRLFESGRSTSFLLFQRENALTNARNAEIRAETDYNKALADLQKVTSTTFEVNNIDVVTPSTDN
jgi:outer membrane protein